jgi:hypothetical protein
MSHLWLRLYPIRETLKPVLVNGFMVRKKMGKKILMILKIIIKFFDEESSRLSGGTSSDHLKKGGF